MFNIINPINKKPDNISSIDGINTLKNYLKYYQSGGGDYFKPNSGLTIDKKKYCRCVMHVLPKNTKTCNKNRFPVKKKGCYNPYAVCASKIKTSTGRQSCKYNFKDKDIKIEELKAYAHMIYNSLKPFMKENRLGNLDNLLKTNNKTKLGNILSKWYDSKKST